jgi:hypothetical protein
MNSKYVIVNDHQVGWVAERSDLLGALEQLGWQRDGNIWTEPDAPEDDEMDGNNAYAKLCGTVRDCGAEVPDEDRADLPEFRFRPDMSDRTWEMGE